MLLLALATPSAVFKLPMKAVYAPIDANQKADTVKAAIAKIVAGC